MAMMTRFEPFREIARLQDEMARLIDERRFGAGESVGWTPACDIYEDEEAVSLRFDLAGVDSKDVDVRFENGVLTLKGVQCHIAYPERGRSPILPALPALAALAATEWDRGNEYFSPTSFQISNIHAGTGANNVIPGTMELLFNFRFSPESSRETLQARVHEVLDRHGLTYTLDWTLSGPPFSTPRGPLVDALSRAIEAETGVRPRLSTSGGTSDGRFLADVAREVVEFGPLNDSIHKLDERVRVSDLDRLTRFFEDAVRARLT